MIEEAKITDIWRIIESKLHENGEPYQDLTATYGFQLIDHDDHNMWQLVFEDGNVHIFDHHQNEANCTLKMKEKNFRKFLLGDLNSTTAFMTGKLKVEGNIGLALKLEGLLKQYKFS
ncbi:sterol-binding protein [Ornithinibacillus sp. L9]|uniref:Sterol-binding protein n=2 Tax=Ornithinibacillus caprae TaxID=2678566 RepID=A0A6N8FJX8_9BACI|nr:sterol-binding protein [Ornithinibacillus caprae]